MEVFFWGEWWHFIPRNNGAANHPINGFHYHSLARNFRYNFYVSFNILRVAWKVYELSHRWCVTISHFVDLIVTHSVRSIGGAAYSTPQDIISWYERASKLILGTECPYWWCIAVRSGRSLSGFLDPFPSEFSDHGISVTDHSDQNILRVGEKSIALYNPESDCLHLVVFQFSGPPEHPKKICWSIFVYVCWSIFAMFTSHHGLKSRDPKTRMETDPESPTNSSHSEPQYTTSTGIHSPQN